MFRFITFLKVILIKLSDFQREATKERIKNETCDHTYSTRLARATIRERNFSLKCLLVLYKPKLRSLIVHVFLDVFSVLRSFFLQNTDVILTDT